jgi:Putative heavy-metal-binding
MRKCRFCAKEMQDSARVCEHCGKDMVTGRVPTVLAASIIVTTGDVRRDYDILGPVYFQVSNKGIFGSALSKLVSKYSGELSAAKKQGQVAGFRPDWGFLYGEWSVGQSEFEKAFFVAVKELQARAGMLGADAVIGMRQDIDMDTTAFQYFYLQMYGTAVKFREAAPTPGIGTPG